MKLKNFKHLICLLALSATSSLIPMVQVNTNIWAGVTSFFDRLDDVLTEMANTQQNFDELEKTLKALTEGYKVRDDKRYEVFSCIINKFKKLKSEIDECITASSDINEQGELSKAKLVAQIEELKQKTKNEIATLNTEINTATKHITEFKAGIASLSQMNTEAVDNAVYKLGLIGQGYQAFIVKRAAMLEALQSMMDRLKAYNFDTNSDIAVMKEAYCPENS